jgi:hypothetical protein
MNQIMRQNYLDASLPGSLSGFQSFSCAFKERDVKLVNLPGKRPLNVNQIVELSQQDKTLKFNEINSLIDNVKSKF